MSNPSKKQTISPQKQRDPQLQVAEPKVHARGVAFQMQGPLPDAMSYAAYEETTPGAGDRILAMAENEQRHRHEMEAQTVKAQIEDMRKNHGEMQRAQWFALIVALSLIGLGTFLVYTGNPLHGSILGGATIAGVVTAFLKNRYSNNVDIHHKK